MQDDDVCTDRSMDKATGAAERTWRRILHTKRFGKIIFHDAVEAVTHKRGTSIADPLVQQLYHARIKT